MILAFLAAARTERPGLRLRPGTPDAAPGTAWRRRASAAAGSAANAVATSTPAAIRTSSSQPGMPPLVGARARLGAVAPTRGVVPPAGAVPFPGTVGWELGWAGAGALWAGGDWCLGRAAGGRPGAGPRVPGPEAAESGAARTVPGRIRSGSGPMAFRLPAYSVCQPPGTLRTVAMPESVSPGATV